MKSITLHKGKESSLLRFHPWIFSGAIKITEGNPDDGDLIEVYSADKKFIGTAHYQKGSISARILSFEKEIIDQDFWNRRIRKAYDYRAFNHLTNDLETNVYRLVFGEGDGLPGLVIDQYNRHLVVQCHTIGMHKSIQQIATALQEVYGSSAETIYDKSKETLPKFYTDKIENSFLLGRAGSTIVKEYGNQFHVDWIRGQKTGFFIDQRENRKLLTHYTKNKSVLNTFCYTGGFSVYAGTSGVAMIHSVDSSAPAIEITEKNMQLNSIKQYENFCTDTFDFLKDKKDLYDVIILDPPAFAKSRDVKHNAVIGYKNLNISALRQIKKGGILFTFSCSGVIDRNLFHNTINAAVFEAKRKTRILHYLQQPADHPLLPNFPEGEYLKGLVLYVE